MVRKNRSQPTCTSGSWARQLTPSPVRAASIAPAASRTVPWVSWKKPGRYAGLAGSVSAAACSAGSVYRRVCGSYSTKPPAAWAPSHSRA